MNRQVTALTPDPSPKGEGKQTPSCPACGKTAVGLEVRGGELFAQTVRITGWVCVCGKVVHYGKIRRPV